MNLPHNSMSLQNPNLPVTDLAPPPAPAQLDQVVVQLLLHGVPISTICSTVPVKTALGLISNDARLHARLPELEQYIRSQVSQPIQPNKSLSEAAINLDDGLQHDIPKSASHLSLATCTSSSTPSNIGSTMELQSLQNVATLNSKLTVKRSKKKKLKTKPATDSPLPQAAVSSLVSTPQPPKKLMSFIPQVKVDPYSSPSSIDPLVTTNPAVSSRNENTSFRARNPDHNASNLPATSFLPPVSFTQTSKVVLDISDSEEDAIQCQQLQNILDRSNPRTSRKSEPEVQPTPVKIEAHVPANTAIRQSHSVAKGEKRKAEDEPDLPTLQQQLEAEEENYSNFNKQYEQLSVQCDALKTQVQQLLESMQRAIADHNAANVKLSKLHRQVAASSMKRNAASKNLEKLRQKIQLAEHAKRQRRQAEHQELKNRYTMLLKRREMLSKPKPPPLAIKLQAILSSLKETCKAPETRAAQPAFPRVATLEQCVLLNGEWLPPSLLLLPSNVTLKNDHTPSDAVSAHSSYIESRPVIPGVLSNDAVMSGTCADLYGLAQSSSNWAFKPFTSLVMLDRALSRVAPGNASIPSGKTSDADSLFLPASPQTASGAAPPSLLTTLKDIALCTYEVSGGLCNDPNCEFTHFRELDSNQAIEQNLIKSVRKTASEAIDPNSLLSELTKAINQCKTDAEVVNAVIRICDDTEKALHFLPSSSPLFEHRPVTLQGILKMLSTKQATRPQRYWQAQEDDAILEKRVKDDPQNERYWLELALHKMPKSLTEHILNDPENDSLHLCLNALQRGLQHVPHSNSLWELYLELLPRKELDAANIRKAMEAAIERLPTNWNVWWKYVCWAKSLRLQTPILIRFFSVVVRWCTKNTARSATTGESHLLLDVLMNVCVSIEETWGYQAAAIFLNTVLCAEDTDSMLSGAIFTIPCTHNPGTEPFPSNLAATIFGRLLCPLHYAFAWSVLLHAQVHAHIPGDIFYNGPYNYHVRAIPFVILSSDPDPFDEGSLPMLIDRAAQLAQWWARTVAIESTWGSMLGVMVMHAIQLANGEVPKLQIDKDSIRPYLKVILSEQEQDGSQKYLDPLSLNIQAKKMASSNCSKDKLVLLLVNNVRQPYPKTRQLSKVAPSDVQLALGLYKHQLGLPCEIPNDLKASRTAARDGCANQDDAMWINMILLQHLSAENTNDVCMDRCFSRATIALRRNSMIWKEYGAKNSIPVLTGTRYLQWAVKRNCGDVKQLIFDAITNIDQDLACEYATVSGSHPFLDLVKVQVT